MARQSFSLYPIEVEPSPAFPDGFTAYRPVASISLGSGDRRTQEFFGVVDTGSDYCMFPSDYLTTLGIEQTSLPMAVVHGVGRDEEVRFATINLRVGLLGQWPVYAGFSDRWSGENVGFLGRLGFLENFHTVFDYRTNRFEFWDGVDG